MNYFILSALFLLPLNVIAVEVFHSPHEERYTYLLEQGDDPVCEHMVGVFNTRFKTPWDGGYMPYQPNPTLFGIPYDQVFERMPGVEYSMRDTFHMRLSRFPISDEFEALRWIEGRIIYRDTKDQFPILITRWVPKNGGVPLWIIKTTFMYKMTTDEGYGQSDGGSDTLSLISDPAFRPNVPLDAKQLSHRTQQSDKAVSLGRETARQLRPFVFRNQLFIAAYQSTWREPITPYAQSPRTYPDDEYMNILKLLPGSIPGKYVDLAQSEIICRIRMLMQPITPNKGGK